MKLIRRYVLTVALSLAVLLSLVLSVILWSNPSYKQTKRSHLNNYQSSLVSKSMADIYMPTQAIHIDHRGHQDLIIDHMVNVMSEIRKPVVRCRYGHPREISHGSNRTYARYLNRRRSLLLNYSGNVTMRLLSDITYHRFQTTSHRQFNRIVLPLNRSRSVYLLRDAGRVVYRIPIRKYRLTRLNRIVKRSLKRIPVKLTLHQGLTWVDYPNGASMPQYEYLVNHQSEDYYIMHLLNNSQRIAKINRKNYVAYSNDAGQRLRFDRYKNVDYLNRHASQTYGGFDRMLVNSYHHLLDLTTPLNGVHYFGASKRNRTVTYRGFVEGFPVFTATQFGAVNFKYSGSAFRCGYSLDSLQIPVPNERKSVKLPPTQTVLRTLKRYGYKPRDINDLEIGYRWQSAKSSKLLANLTPEWFIEYHHHWISYNQLRVNSIK